jgi:hypothetical protein
MEVADKGYDIVECGFTLVPEEENNFIYAKNTSLYMFHSIVGASLQRGGNGKGEHRIHRN